MWKTCVVCGRRYESYDRVRGSGRRSNYKRPHRSKSCSKECARVLGRNYKKIFRKLNNQTSNSLQGNGSPKDKRERFCLIVDSSR